LRFSAPALCIHKKLRARNKKSPYQDCSAPSGMSQTKATLFSGGMPIISLLNPAIISSIFHHLHPPIFKRQHPLCGRGGGHQQITALVLPSPPPTTAKNEIESERRRREATHHCALLQAPHPTRQLIILISKFFKNQGERGLLVA